MTVASVDALLARVRQLPALSPAVARLLAMLNRPEVSIHAITEHISRDQSLAARILKVANSAFYGHAGRVAAIGDAAVILGLHSVRSLVLAAGVIGQFAGAGSARFDRKRFWQHSIGVASAARVLARQARLDEEAAFSAGLLHDLGKLILDIHLPAEFRQVLDHATEHNCPMRESELAVLGLDHCALGAALVHHWKLPADIETAIRHHHSPQLATDTRMAGVVHVADALCYALGIGAAEDDRVPHIESGAWAGLGLNEVRLRRCLGETEALYQSATLLLTAD